MVLIQEYVNDESADDSFVVHPTGLPQRLSFKTSLSPDGHFDCATPSVDASFHDHEFGEYGPIKTACGHHHRRHHHHHRRLIMTNADIQPSFPLSTDVFGESLSSLDVWAEEDMFVSHAKCRHGSKREGSSPHSHSHSYSHSDSHSHSNTGTPTVSSKSSSRFLDLNDNVDLICL